MVSAGDMKEEKEVLVTSIFLIRPRSDVISSLCFACSKEITAVTADMTALVIDYSTEGSMKWLGM